jgi:hypothetical protein
MRDAGCGMRGAGWSIWLGVMVLLFSSCGEDAPLTLSWEERSFVDSLFREEVKVLKPELDSICDLHFDSLKSYYVDSLWNNRIEEIERQLQRIQLQ